MNVGDHPHVLVIEQDDDVLDSIRRPLESDDFEVTVATNGPSGLAAARDLSPDVIVMDAALPQLSGVEVCARLREHDDSTVPIILLTSTDEPAEQITELNRGADDYVLLPIQADELVQRVDSVLRSSLIQQSAQPVAGLVVDDNLALNPVLREALLDGQPLSLTIREFDLLKFLVCHPRRVFDAQDLLHSVWEWEVVDSATVTFHIERLRHKIEIDPANPTRLVAVAGAFVRWIPTL